MRPRIHGTTCLIVLALALTVRVDASDHPTVGDAHEGRFAGEGGTQLYYRCIPGPPDTVVVVHGGPGNDSGYLLPDLMRLTSAHTVIAYDQRGGGRSELPEDTGLLTIQHHVRDLEALRRHFELDSMTLVAHSFGPLLAAYYAAEHPQRVRRMVFLGAVPPRRADLWERFEANVGAVLDAAERERMGELWQELCSGSDPVGACRAFWKIALKPRIADPARIADLRGDLCGAPAAAIQYGMATTNAKTMESIGDWDLTESLSSVAAPTLVVHGQEEVIPMDLVTEWTTALPSARLLEVAGAAHFPYVEAPEIVWPAILEFLAGSWPDGATGAP